MTAFREETTEERSRRNAALREMLASASNHAIAIARKMGGLTEREFWKRMEAGQNFPIDLLLDLACTLVTTSPAKKKTGQKLEAITQAIARYAPSAQGDEVVAALDYFSETVLGRDTFLLPELVLARADGEEIIQGMITAIPNPISSQKIKTDTSLG